MCWIGVKLHTGCFSACVCEQCQSVKCLYVHIMCVCVSIVVCSWCDCVPFGVLGARIGLSVTVK